MPSQTHAVLVDLFRTAPSLALDLLSASGITVAAAGLRILDSTFPVTSSPDYHVDLAVACDDATGAPTLVVLVEVQLDPDPDKRFTWPLYLAAARMRYRCDACVLVVAIEERVAVWARTPVSLGPGGCTFQPVVLGPSAVPRATEPATPELAVLSALARGESEPEAVRLAMCSIDALGQDRQYDRAAAYFDLLQYHLGAALDRALEAIMTTSERRYLSDFANDYFDKGRAQGQAEGKLEGKLEGEVAGARAALLSVATARGIPLTPSDRERIDACDDPVVLAAWVVRAARATTAAEIFTG
jgi:hypothetical protein